jgi:hypothetical protein
LQAIVDIQVMLGIFANTMVPVSKTKPFFGCITLPLDEHSPFWSDVEDVDELLAFKNRNNSKRLIALAGSIRPPYDLEDVIKWAENHDDWCFVCVGLGYESQKIYEDGSPNRFLFLEYIEF